MVACGPADGGRVEESIRGGLSMDRTVYSGAEGFVVNYKTHGSRFFLTNFKEGLRGRSFWSGGMMQLHFP